MSQQLTSIAAEINSEHSLAMSHADIAIDHAKRVGGLLLQVKNSLPHGDFLPWVAANITVSERQAQRYIRAALGKPIPVRALANTTPVSDFLDWLPKSPCVALVDFDDGTLLEMQESADHRGFYYIAYVAGDLAFTIKPMHSSFVEQVIFDWLPGKHTRDCSIRNLQWDFYDAPPYCVREIIEPHLPDGYEHLRRNRQLATGVK